MFIKYLYVSFVILSTAVTLESLLASKTRFMFDIHNMSCHRHGNRLKVLECTNTKIAPGHFTINFRFMGRQKLGKDIEIQLKLSLKPLKGNKVVNFVDIKVNLCVATSQIFGNVLLKAFVDEIRRTSNVPYACPYKESQAIPPFAPSLNSTLAITVYEKDQLIAEYNMVSSLIRLEKGK